jgi:hypothetical protein
MARDSLRRLVDQGDRERARPSRIEPERLILAPRTTGTKRICIDCRRVHDAFEHYNAWFRRMQFLPTEERTAYAPQSPCRDCGGELVEVTW